METKKQEAIRLAYGEYYEPNKELIDKNGWFNPNKGISFLEAFKDLIISSKIYEESLEKRIKRLFEQKFDIGSGNQHRLKSLSGIEDNNGWISIESEEDLPKHLEMVWLIDPEFGTDIGFYNEELKKWYSDTIEQFPTHYQPIQKPNPPIF